MAVILVAEDEKNMQDIIVEYMKRGGHSCIAVEDGMDSISVFKHNMVDLVILDVMMPNLDGFTVCKIIRDKYNIPIIFLTAKSDEADKLRGYEYGADDYMTKPFSPKVLLAKVNALLRRSSSNHVQETLVVGNIVLVQASHSIIVAGNEVDLTYKEFELLRFFMQNKNQVFSREQLLNRIWGYDFEGNTRTVDTHIKTLRQKLGAEGHYIVTLIRSGYKFEV